MNFTSRLKTLVLLHSRSALYYSFGQVFVITVNAGVIVFKLRLATVYGVAPVCVDPVVK